MAARRAGSNARRVDELLAAVGADGVSVDPRPGSVYVQAGDSLSKIAARFPEYGNANDLKNQLIAANPQLRDPNALTEGMELNFPGAGTVVDRAAMARAVGADGRYQTAMAARQQGYWDSLQAGAWSGRTGDGDPVWHVGGTGAAGAAGPLDVRGVVDRANNLAYNKDLTREQLLGALSDVRTAMKSVGSAEEQLWLQGAALSLHEVGAGRSLMRPGETVNSPEMLGLGVVSMAFGGSNGAVPSGITPASGYAGPSFRSAFRAFEFDNEPHNAAAFAQYRNVLATTEAANPLVESLQATGALPANFMTKQQAAQAGWQPGKALGNYLPGGQIGGDEFLNTTGVVPPAAGRTWYEADVGLVSTMKRSTQPGTRLLYSNDGLLYVTPNHYETVYPIGTWKR